MFASLNKENFCAHKLKLTHLFSVLLFLILILAPISSVFADKEYQALKIVDPYIELHTGPGRGYPIFHVVERHEWVEVIKRRTDWFKVRTDRDVTGWVRREQMERTLTVAGVPKSFRDVVYDDFLHRRVEFGISAGEFDSDPIFSARLAYKFNENVALELQYSKVAGKLSSSDIYAANLVSIPFPDWRVAPHFTIGYGRFENEPKGALIQNEKTKDDMANLGIGARYYLTREFFLRADYRRYIVLSEDDRNDEFDEISAGVSFFF